MHIVSQLQIRIFLFLVLAFNLFATPSYAAERPWRPIIAVGGGTSSGHGSGGSVNFPLQVTDEIYDYSANHRTQTSMLGEVFFGAERTLRPNLSLQLGVDYNQATPFYIKGTFLQGADEASADTFGYGYHAVTRQLLFEGKLLTTIEQRYHPYLLAGIGASFNKAYDFYTNVPADLTFTRMYGNRASSSFSYALGIGADVDLTSYMRFGIGYRFANLGKVSLGNATVDTINVSGTLSQNHFYTHEVLAQITFVL